STAAPIDGSVPPTAATIDSSVASDTTANSGTSPAQRSPGNVASTPRATLPPESSAPPAAATPDSTISSTPDSAAPPTIPTTESSASATTAAVNLVVTYGVDPSDAAKMVCATEAQEELSAAFNT